MARRGPRGLKPGEVELWRQIAATTTPLHPGKVKRQAASPRGPAGATPPSGPAPAMPDAVPIAPFSIGARPSTAAPPPQPSAPPVKMDRKAFDRMRRGKSAPDGRIDLHGMTAQTAKGALTAYLLSAHARGQRLVLVITGKGRDRDDDGPIPARRGVLRHNVPHWLQLPPLSSVVLQVTEAHQRHGGSGALYVYLRRPR